MKQKGVQFLTKYSGLYADSLLARASLTEITGNKRVLIEQHKGIGSYSKDEIRVHIHDGCICVNGNQLKLEYISREMIVISGEIFRVTFLKEGRVAAVSD